MTVKLWLENNMRALRYLARTGMWCRHPNMGSWWEFNYGTDEVRMCPDCDRVETRETHR